MIYCNLIEKKENEATYSYGTSPDKMSGEMIVFRDKPPMVKKEAEESEKMLYLIGKVFLKYKKEFLTFVDCFPVIFRMIRITSLHSEVRAAKKPPVSRRLIVPLTYIILRKCRFVLDRATGIST